MLGNVRAHAVPQQHNGPPRVQIAYHIVNPQSVGGQQIPAGLIRKVASMLSLLPMTSMVVGNNGQAACRGQSCKLAVALVMLAKTVKNLHHAIDLALWPPVCSVNAPAIGTGKGKRLNLDVIHTHTLLFTDDRILQDMIDLYYWPTPNGHKISIMLEECGLAYTVIPVNIGIGDQFAPEFLKIAPNNRMPAIVDHDSDLSVFEGGAILMYLAEKSGKLMPQGQAARYDVLQWLLWQAGGLGPMAGQLSHFVSYTRQDVPYAHKRYADEYDRLLGVMDVRLRDRDYLAGEYSIADIACFVWVRPYRRLGNDLDKFKNLRAWFDAIKKRSAVRVGTDLGLHWKRDEKQSDAARAMIFGQTSKTVFDAADAADAAGK